MANLNGRIEQLISALPELKEAAGMSLTYLPGTGTVVEVGGHVLTTIPGKDFADALLAAWVGEHPLNEDLKRQLLGA